MFPNTTLSQLNNWWIITRTFIIYKQKIYLHFNYNLEVNFKKKNYNLQVYQYQIFLINFKLRENQIQNQKWQGI